ncbi:MAG: hypothetical protein J1G06_08260 [Oscillospiraceae bacterium]|nr:hypothetical protein [Oscillospiraceae bacterium]
MKIKRIISIISAVVIALGVMPVLNAAAADKLLAFPGAEGGGKYTTGARGASKIEVYHVTNLNDSGSGSLRDAVSKEGRIVVFDVGGVINLKSKLYFNKKNVTVLGQTAPGDGITITGYDAEIQKDNIILRYLRIRPTDNNGGEPDGLGGRWVHDIIIDHCSLSWSVDELLTLYAGSLESNTNVSKNLTVQYCLASESLRMSNHIKGAHGYGGIVGGTNATWHHNLFAHHDSRSPRFDRNLKSTDFSNNVIYNWGNTNSLYGAEPYSYNSVAKYSTPEYVSNVNIRNNYYKYGPSTRPAYRSRIFDVTNDGSVKYDGVVLKSNLYIDGNYVYGDSAATSNNTASGSYINNKNNVNLLKSPVDMGDYETEIETAEEAYETTLADVGATLPRRDAIDSRIVADVKNGTGRVINTDEEVGSLGGMTAETRAFAIPDSWKSSNGMGSAKETDKAPSGYTWIEEYVNDWTEEQSAPTNPEIYVSSPAVANTDKTYDRIGSQGFWEITDGVVNYNAHAFATGDTEITKMELWDGTERIREYNGDDGIDDNITLAPGTHYLMSRAYNDRGESAQSPVSIVYVTGANEMNVTEIGSVPYPGESRIWEDSGKTYIAGSGSIYGKSDSLSFDAHSTNGDFVFTCKVEDIPKYENSVQCGIMFRESLDANSRMIMVSDLWRKYGENIQIARRTSTGGDADFVWMKDKNGKEIANGSSYDSSVYTVPKYLKLERKGNTLTVSVSNNGTNWTNNARQPMSIDISGWSDEGYVGLAVDSVNGDAKDVAHPPLAWFTIAAFSDINIIGEKTPCVKITADYNEDGSLKEIKSIENTYVEEVGESVVDGMHRVFIWENLDKMKPIKEKAND